MAWTYDEAQLETSALYRVRLALGDTNDADPQLQDEEIETLLLRSGSEAGAVRAGARALAARYARSVDKWVGDLKILASQRSRAYQTLADSYSGAAGVVAVPSAGGIRVTDKDAITADTDLVAPYFVRNIHDNTEE